jgi:Peptidase family M1 domain
VTVALSLRRGFIDSTRRIRSAVTLYAVNLVAAGLAAWPMAALLDRTLGHSTSARDLDAFFRYDVLLDFLRANGAAIADQFQLLGAGALLYAAVSSVLMGGVVDTLRAPIRSPFLPRFLGGCGRFALRFVRLLPYLALALAAIHFLNQGLNRLILMAFDQSVHEAAAFWTMRGAQALMLLILVMVAAIFDLARILTAVEDRTHMIGALLTAAGFVSRHLVSVLGIYSSLLAVGLLVFAPYFLLAHWLLPAASIGGLVAAQQAVILVRQWLRVTEVASLLAFYRGATGGTSPDPGSEEAAAVATSSGAHTEAARRETPSSPRDGSKATLPRKAVWALSVAGSVLICAALLAARAPSPRQDATSSTRPDRDGRRSSPARGTGSLPGSPGRAADAPATADGAGPARRVVVYTIDARLRPETHLVQGKETIVYRNTTRSTMSELKFHLYPNAFSNTRSTYMRGGAWADRTFQAQLERITRDATWGFMTITSVRIPGGADLTSAAAIDETVMTVPLPVRVGPGGSVQVEVTWETSLPKTFHRMGYWGDHHDVMQWFPKLAVFTDSGWKSYPFYRYSEFFADFGTYDVTLTVPRSLRVEATGVPGPARDNPDGTRSVSYHAEDVHDFAWIADPHMLVAREMFSEGPYASSPVEILFCHRPDHSRLAARILGIVKDGLRYYGDHFVPYPYPRIVVDDLPMGLGGGMEYPMLFTTSMAFFHPRFYTSAEEVTLHEFGHQYWYGLLATNEFEEPWLDEGINSYVTRHAMDAAYPAPRRGRTASALFAYGAARVLDEGIALPLGKAELNLDQLLGFESTPFRPAGRGLLGARLVPFALRLPGLEDGWLQWSRAGYGDVARDDPMATPAWGFFPGSYSSIVYDKTDLVLETFNRLLGGRVVDEALRQYVQRCRLTHPTAREFLGILEGLAHQARPDVDLHAAIDQLVYGTGTVDFEVSSLKSRPAAAPRGWIPRTRAGESPTDQRMPPAVQDPAPPYETEVIVRRQGEVILPIDLLVRFEDGEERHEVWDAKETWKRFTYETRSRASSAVIDPGHLFVIDLDVNNNGKTLPRQSRPVVRLALTWLFLIQNYLHLASSLS